MLKAILNYLVSVQSNLSLNSLGLWNKITKINIILSLLFKNDSMYTKDQIIVDADLYKAFKILEIW